MGGRGMSCCAKNKGKMYYRLAQSVRTKARIAGNWDWVHRNGIYDIIAVEIVEFAK
jgi:hypothetical protein